MPHINKCKAPLKYVNILDDFTPNFLFHVFLEPKTKFRKPTLFRGHHHITCTWTQSRNEDQTPQIRITTLNNSNYSVILKR